MAAQLRSVQFSLRIGQQDLDRIREAALVSGETIARFVREAARERCMAVEARQPDDVGASCAESPDQLSRVERLVLAAVTSSASLRSVADVARAARVSWSAARHALNTLSARGTVRIRASERGRRSGVREVSVWEPAVASPDFEQPACSGHRCTAASAIADAGAFGTLAVPILVAVLEPPRSVVAAATGRRGLRRQPAAQWPVGRRRAVGVSAHFHRCAPKTA